MSTRDSFSSSKHSKRVSFCFALLMVSAGTLAMLAPAAVAVDAQVPFTPLATVYAEDFELGAGGWTAGGTASTWALGTPAAASGPAAAFSGLNAWGTNLVGDYANSECSAVTSPPIGLPGAGAAAGDGTVSAARLGFSHWLVAENRYDGAVVQVTTDAGATWSTVAPPGGYPVDLLTSARRCLLGSTEPTPPPMKGWSGTFSTSPSDWRLAEVDLTGFLGQTVQVRFAFASDSSVVKRGWYVDDVLVQVGAGAFADPDTATPDVEAFQPVTTLYAEDFELGEGGWTSGGTASSWAFGTPTTGPSGPASGANVWATNLHGNYNPSECSWLMSPPIELPGAGAQLPDGVTVETARLYLSQWFNAENRYDGGLVQASTDDGATWATLTASPAYNDVGNTAARACLGLSTTDKLQTGTLSTKPDEWLDLAADLTPFLGQTVRVRLAFASDSSVQRVGWYVDDVAIVAGAGARVADTVAPGAPDVVNTTVPYVGIETAYAEGFEDGLGGWTLGQNKVDTRTYLTTFAHGTPAFATGPAAVSGKVWGTNLVGSYVNNECGAVTSPAIDLTGVSGAVSLEYRQWLRTENAYDAGIVSASTDGGATWTILTPTTPNGYPVALNTAARQCFQDVYSSTPPAMRGFSGAMSTTTTAWHNAAFDLSPFAGESVTLRFRYASDSSVVSGAGWYFDNVTLKAGASNVAFYDFESGAQGWTAAPTPITKPMSWETGAPVVGPSGAAAGASVLGTNLDGNYSDGECTSVTSPVIDLTGHSDALSARLSMKQWFSAGSGDAGLVQWRVDGGAWSVLVPEGGYTTTSLSFTARTCMGGLPTAARGYTGALSATGDWSDAVYRLPEAIGHTVQFRLLFAADTITAGPGWYVDEAAVTLGVFGDTVGSMVPAVPEAPPTAFRIGDDRLREALLGKGPHGEDKFLDILVGGPELEIAPQASGDRSFWISYFEDAARPFTDAVVEYVAAKGGETTGVFATSPAVAVRVHRDSLEGLANVRGVERLTLDDDESVQLIAPEIGDEKDGFHAENAQSVPMTQAPDIWSLGYRGEGVKIAIIDTGIHAQHPVFLKAPGCTVSRVEYWKDFVSGLTTPYDDHGHGTHVGGTAAGSTECGGWANGVAPAATLMGIKFLDSGGGGSFANGIASLNWAFNNSADVTSNSWGSSCSASMDTLRTVNNLAKAGMPSVFAAGNSGGAGTIGGPGCAEFAITVGSTDKSMVVSSFSSRGPCTDPTESGVSRICPDVMAVGSGVVSSVPTGSCAMCTPWGYRLANGTSMATPHVGGAVALMIQFKKALTGSDWDTPSKAEETALRLTALDLGATGDDNNYGSGFIQLLPIYNLLANPGVPDVRDLFSTPAADMRVGNTATLGFRVSNTGTGSVDGHFRVALTTPDGTTVLDERDVTLGFGSSAAHSMPFAVTAATAAGTYTYAGDFTYSWVDENDVVHTGEIHRVGTWVVRKVDIRVLRDMPAVADLGVPFTVVLTMENRGNEDASNLVVEETVRDAYAFLPGFPDAFNSNWIYATPAPDSVSKDSRFGRTTLGWNVGDFPAGSTYVVSYTLVPTKTGTFPFIGVAKYLNGAGQAQLVGSVDAQTVVMPSPPSTQATLPVGGAVQ